MNRKIISAPCYSWRHGCAKREQDALFAQLLAWHLLPWSGRFLSVFVDHAAHPSIRRWVSWRRRLWRSGRRICRSPWRKTALSLTLRRADIRRGFILPLPSLSPALIAFASEVIPYHNKPMFSEPRRD